MMMMPITGLIKAGENVTFTGTGTVADPYVVSAAGGGATHLVAGENVTITGTGSETDPFVVSAVLPQRGPKIKLALDKAFTFYAKEPALSKNPDGSISLSGCVAHIGSMLAVTSYFAPVPKVYSPEQDYTFVGAAEISGTTAPVPATATITVIAGGAIYVRPPRPLGDREQIRVWLDGMTYWPGA